jgi:hypothetical protein
VRAGETTLREVAQATFWHLWGEAEQRQHPTSSRQ